MGEALRKEKAQFEAEIAGLRRAQSDRDTVMEAQQTQIRQLQSAMQKLKEKLKEKQKEKGSESGQSNSNGKADAELAAKYKELNRDHEDLLVFVGHLHEKFESSQKEMSALRSRVEALKGGREVKNRKKQMARSVDAEAKSME